MLSKSKIKAALKILSWSKLQAELDMSELTETSLNEVLGHIRREDGLIFNYPNTKSEERRTELLEELRAYVERMLGPVAAEDVVATQTLLKMAEDGYRRILVKLRDCDVSKLAPKTRISASIYRAAHEYDHMNIQLHKALRNKHSPDVFLQGPISTDKEANFSPDGTLEAIVASLTNTLIMEAHNNSWFENDQVVIPILPKVDEDELFMAGSTQLLAMMWQAWRKTEQRLRYLGGNLESLTPPNLPEGAPDDAECVLVFRPTEEEFYDYIANERLGDRLTQHFLEMHTELDIRGKLATRGKIAKLSPTEYVSEEEAHAAITLSDMLSYSIAHDNERPGGLRVVEWLRGYAALQQIAGEADYQVSENPDALVQFINSAELADRLKECGLSDRSVDVFISAVALHRKSRDLFDCPLVRSSSGDYLLFLPALLNANLSQIVFSVLSSRGATLEKKGRAFEQDLRRKLSEVGLEAKAFKVNRAGEEYEYDAVLPWGDYIFVFECKNQGLSHRKPQLAYHFASTAQSNAGQVVRLANALEQFPDILTGEFGENLSDRVIVPCVVNALPYARAGRLDGAYFTDASSLVRFFKERYANIVIHFSVDENVRIKHRNAVHSFWKGEKPTPEDLLCHLEDPYQVKNVKLHTKFRTIPFAVGINEYLLAVEFERTALSVESIAKSANVDAGIVRTDIETVASAVRQTRLEAKNPIRKRSRRKRKKPNVRRKY